MSTVIAFFMALFYKFIALWESKPSESIIIEDEFTAGDGDFPVALKVKNPGVSPAMKRNFKKR